jgi:hypothetical protein
MAMQIWTKKYKKHGTYENLITQIDGQHIKV